MTRSQNQPAQDIVIHTDNRTGPPDLRFLHYNDVYNPRAGSEEPAGGVGRFQTLAKHYSKDVEHADASELITFFSGDAFNPSLESTVTRGSHMVPILNAIGTSAACVGNHELDFGAQHFNHLRKRCTFPWVLTNVDDPKPSGTGPLGGASKTLMLESSNGFKIGVMGLVEREFLLKNNSLPLGIIYQDMLDAAKEYSSQLREQGADMVVALTHARQPRDKYLGEKVPEGVIDIILAGHDHVYEHIEFPHTMLVRSGTDFKNLSYLQAWKKQDGSNGWDFTVIRRDLVREIPEEEEITEMVHRHTRWARKRLEKPIGCTKTALDARRATVCLRESNLGNFTCDRLREYWDADCAILMGGAIKGDRVIPPGVIRLKMLTETFPFEDPVVVVRVTGKAIKEALENGVSKYPETDNGIFTQVSNIYYSFDPDAEPGSRIRTVKLAGEPIDTEKQYTVATRAYMAFGKDGFESLHMQSEGGTAEEVVNEEEGVLLSMIVRQYLEGLKASTGFEALGGSTHENGNTNGIRERANGNGSAEQDEEQEEDDVIEDVGEAAFAGSAEFERDESLEDMGEDEKRETLKRKYLKTWRHVAGIEREPEVIDDESEEDHSEWANKIAPKLEGRIKLYSEEQEE